MRADVNAINLLAGVVATIAGLTVGFGPWVTALFAVLCITAAAATQKKGLVVVGLTVTAIPLLRPNLLGESYSPVGCAMLVIAAAITLADAGGELKARSESNTYISACSRSFLLWLALAHAWAIFRAANSTSGLEGGTVLQGALLTVISAFAIALILRSRVNSVRIARAFVMLIALLCASYALTATIWLLQGVGAGLVTRVSLIPGATAIPIYAPFTTTSAFAAPFGQNIPRFTGLGREPGWMGMYCALCFILAPLVGLRARWIRILLIIGLAGCISNAAFGALIAALTLQIFFTDSARISMPRRLARIYLGCTALVLAGWLIMDAPILGFRAKGDSNAVSLQERSAATKAGLDALIHNPFFGRPVDIVGGVNLIASIATFGLPYAILISMAILMPLRRHRNRALAVGSLGVIFSTLLVSQPPGDSIWVYGLALLVLEASTAVSLLSESERQGLKTGGVVLPQSRSHHARLFLRSLSQRQSPTDLRSYHA